MCYSTMVERNAKRAGRLLGATINEKAFEEFFQLRSSVQALTPEETKIAFGLSQTPKTQPFRWAPDETDCRVYPGYFAPVMIMENGQRSIVPMRYRVRPAGTPQEIPSRFNLFNCRIDSLETKPTWRRLLGRSHGIFPFVKFYEWVEGEDRKKRQVAFKPEGKELMWAPALYDTWTSTDGSITFRSFAIVTDDPPPEILECGHDRCPIYLSKDNIDAWLEPHNQSKSELVDLLKHQENVYYLSEQQTAL
jgi:putative SOS response-associated peptidase YedK